MTRLHYFLKVSTPYVSNFSLFKRTLCLMSFLFLKAECQNIFDLQKLMAVFLKSTV